MFSGSFVFGQFVDGRMINVNRDKKLLRGISPKLAATGFSYLLTPVWYMYNVRTRLKDIAEK